VSRGIQAFAGKNKDTATVFVTVSLFLSLAVSFTEVI
jgi:hypothetical protein